MAIAHRTNFRCFTAGDAASFGNDCFGLQGKRWFGIFSSAPQSASIFTLQEVFGELSNDSMSVSNVKLNTMRDVGITWSGIKSWFLGLLLLTCHVHSRQLLSETIRNACRQGQQHTPANRAGPMLRHVAYCDNQQLISFPLNEPRVYAWMLNEESVSSCSEPTHLRSCLSSLGFSLSVMDCHKC